MHEPLIGGTLGNWLADIGLVSLIYWAWRLFAALRRGSGRIPVAATAAPPAVTGPSAPADNSVPADDIAVIAAAAFAMVGPHRIVHLEATRPDQAWSVEGRWRQQTSHTPRP